MTTEYNLIKLDGDLDIIMSPTQLSRSKIFVDIKNRLSPYRNKDLYKFINKLRNFNFDIIPIIIARKIYENPKESILNYKGEYIELEKIIIPDNFKKRSEEFNQNIVNITRLIPRQLIPPDIKKKFGKLTKLSEGLNFKRVFRKMSSL